MIAPRMEADLIVVGGGPVGLACAIEGRQAGLDVLIVEPRSTPIDKACGEGLMPGSLAALQRLGVDPPGRTLAGIAYCAPGAVRAEHRFRERPGRGVRRTVLHEALALRAAELGARALTGRVHAVASAADSTTLSLERGELRAPWVIAADGLHSPLRRLLGLEGRTQAAGRRRFGLRQHFAIEPWSDLVEVHWSASVEAYVTPVDDQTVGIAVLGPRPLNLATALEGLPELADRLRNAPPVSSLRGAGPLLQRSRRRSAGRVLLAGDASGYVDALTGEGLRVGFAQTRAAVAAVVADSPDDYERSWQATTRDFRFLTTGLVIAARSPLRPHIVPIAAAIPAIFGPIVERLSR